MNKIFFGDNLPILRELESESVDLIYIDPPFNTGKVQKRTTIKTVQSENGSRKGFQGKSYETTELGTKSYPDSFDSLVDFLRPRLEEAFRILKPYGSLYFHIDYREVYYCRGLLDDIFGRDCFMNEIIWAYDYGARAKSKWPAKHDNILFYVKNKNSYIFNASEIDREQYIAPGLVGPEKAERGKLPTDTWWFSYVGKKPTDTWWQTIVPTNGKERVGYPTQKPRKLIDRIVKASSLKGMVVLDFFAGSGTVGESCLELGRKFILMDKNPASLEVMAQRFSGIDNLEWIGFNPLPFQVTDNFNGKRINYLASDDTYSEDFIMLAASAVQLQNEIEKNDAWNNSPFEWILQLPARQKGKVARQLLISWIERKGIATDRSKDPGENLIISGEKIAIKFSTLWSTGTYKFQQIRKDGYDHLLCFGISPNAVHCWVFDREYAIKNATPQHKGEKGAEYWIDINPKHPLDWIEGCGGSLDEAYQLLKNLKAKNV
jgi:site-specific DNA-methyltransferase (adenine-specific)